MKHKWQIWRAYAGMLGFFSFSAYLWQRFILREKLLQIRVSGLKQPVRIRNQASDHALFTQIFIQKEYGDPVGHSVNRIIDCGANIGLAALYFLSQYPHAAITCVEPDASNFRILSMNTAPYKNITCMQKAVWHKTGALHIHGRSRGAAGLMVRIAAMDEAAETEGMVLDSLVSAQQPVDILKMDIEGSEKQVLLEGDTSWISHVQTLFAELHDDIHSGITEEITRKFAGNFSIRKVGEYHVFEKNQ